MSKRLKRLLAFALSVMLLPVISMTGADASYTTENDVYTWDLKNIMDEIGYAEAEFQAGKAYEYHGLTITGNNAAAKIDEAGVKIGKVTSNNGQMNIAYTPPCPGKLTVTAAITKSGSYLSKIYVSTVLGKTGDAGNPIINTTSAPISAAGTYTGETDLEAGNTYYIYDGSTATAYIESITFAPDLSQATASMTLNNTFSDNMLIQRDKPIILKGSCAFLTGAEIALTNETTNQVEQTKNLDLSGSFSWKTELNAVSNYTDTYTLTITPSDNSIEPIEIKNIIFGDLYLCAGQSNMAVPASFYKEIGIDYTSEQLNTKHNDIRYFNISANNTHTSSPQESVLDKVSWKVLQSGGIPATAYSFAEKLNSETDVPIGIIISAMKGTYISQWLPNTKLDDKNISSNYYNTKIYPFRDMHLSGILWYQGESDRSATDTYKGKLKSLIENYRTLFANEDDVPFYYVQIARYGGGIDPADPTNVNEYDPYMAEVRAIQNEVYSELKDTEENFGIIPTLDLYGNKENDTTYVSSAWGMSRGNARSSIHPGQKNVIAERAVNWVLKDVYGKTKHKDETAIYTTGPVYKSKTSEGGKLTVEYEATGNLKIMDTEQYSDDDSSAAWTKYGIDTSKPQEFEIAGEDNVYYRAEAELDGTKVILSSDNVSAPVNFRYAYTGRDGGVYVECPNLTDDTNLPALVTSTAKGTTAASENEYTKSFTENTAGVLNGRVKAPSDYSEKSYPLVVFLHGEEQKGTDNLAQLTEAQPLFEAVGKGAILVAPQTADAWDADKVKAYIDAVKAEYNASDVAVCGYSMGASVCYELAKNNTAQKIIPIAGNAVLSENDITAIKNNNVSAWVISSYEDDEDTVADIRTTVSAMQKSKADVIYTEYPLLAHDICEKALSQEGLADWILKDTEKNKTVDLVLFAGQSNMAGRGDYESATICPPLQGYEFHAVTDPTDGGTLKAVLSTVSEPFGKYENNTAIDDGTKRNGDMVSSVMKSYYDNSGVPIVGVSASKGGQDTAFFKSDAVMTEIISRYKAAEKYLADSGYTVRKKFMVWCQGCSDADKIISDSTYTLDDYKANTLDIFNQIKTGTGIEDVFMVRIGHRNNNNTEDAVYKTVNEAQAEIIADNEHIYEAGNLYTDAYKSKMRDAYHYYQSAYNSIGLAAGENIAAVYASGTDEPTDPTPDKGFAYDKEKETVTCYENGELIIADYDNGVLKNVDMRKVTDENRVFNQIEAINGRKIMFWDSLSGMTPLDGAVTITDGKTPAETTEPTTEPTTKPTTNPTAEPTDADLYAVYTLDGTENGEISRVKIASGDAGDEVTVPVSAFAARKFTDADGLYDIYSCTPLTDNKVTLKEGGNTVYITVKHENGKYYYWEDFESYETGSIEKDNKWYHGGASTVSDFINCTTDTADATNAARWYSSNTSASRNKSFQIFSGTPYVPEGEKLVFSADFRMSATRNKDYRTSLSFGNGTDTMLLMSVANSITMTVNDSDTVIPLSVSGTKEETGGDSTAFTKWLKVKITIDPSKTENNTTVTLTSLTDGDKFTVNGTEQESYSYTTTSSVNAVTQMSVNLCKGYRGAVVADNIKLYNTQSEYLTPAKNELAQALAIYGDIDKSIYEDNGISAYNTAVTNANNVLADSSSTNKVANDAKTTLINAASSLRLKSGRDGERTVINENPDWIFIKEKNYQSEVSEITENAPDKISLSGWTSVDVPHTWNAYDGSDGGGDYDTCKSWYRKSMYIDSAYEGKKVYLEFDGASIRTELYINGVHIPFSYDNPFGTANSDGVEYEHKGGFNTFRFDITDYVKYGESNTVAVSVDNRIKADTLPLSGDYSREGGIYRDVSLIVTNPVHIDMLDDGSAGLYLTPEKKTAVTDDENKDFTLTAAAKIVNDSDEDRTVKIEASLCEPDHFDIPDNEYIKEHLRFNPEDMYTVGGKTVGEFEAKTVTIKAGESYDYTDTIDVTSPKLWDGLESPYRYEVKLKVTADGTEAESVTETVGFRYFRAPNPEGINKGGSFYLNGRQYPIEGVGKHQDWGKEDGALGIATTEKEMLSDVGTIYELGANGVRLVHYQHSLDEIELYDKLGITVWSEPALCSAMTNADAEAYPAFEKATLYQLGAMIKQQYNKPCVLFWGFSNEITHEWDDNLKQIAAQEKKFTSAPALFLKMQNLAKSLDPVRLTTYAANTRRHYDDLYTDITGSNIYPYWYVNRTAASVAKNDYESLQKWITDGTTKPISVSEYGGAAIVGNTYEYNADGSVDFLGTSAESNTTYQAYLHEKVYKEFITSASAYWGKYVWQMFDSASDGKTDGAMLGINTKGLVSYDHTTRKDAYYFYKANWNDFEPFAYVVNASRTQRPDPTTIIRAYTNMDLCQLYVNGEKYGEPITDTNENDKVADGVHVFMWYDVPLTGGDDKIEVRGIKDGKETCSSLSTNGEITFKTMFDGTSIKSNDTSKLIINGSDSVLQCMAKDAPEISEMADLVTILSTSNISVIMPDDTAVTSGKLSEGMKIRVTAVDSTHKDYTVKVDDITSDAVITASEGDASCLLNGDTAVSWNGGADSSVTIDLGAEYNLNAVDMYSTGEISYTAQVSSDGTSFAATTVTDGKFAADTSGRYVRFTFTNAAEISEINIYGWRFDNIGNYRIDGKNIYLSTSSEHDTDEIMTNLLLVGQAAYDFVLEEATRVLSDGAILQVTEKYGDTVDYTIKISD